MCRMLVYAGPPITPAALLLDMPHSLYQQALHPRELRYTHINADGFGFGWYPRPGQPAVYRRSEPIWQDPNLADLAASLQAGLWLANVRSATGGLDIHVANTQPFVRDDWLFMHNGILRDFNSHLRARLIGQLGPEAVARIQGNTDSEYLLELLRHDLSDLTLDSCRRGLPPMLGWLEARLEHRPALLNLFATDGRWLLVTRTSVNEYCASLYVTTNHARFPGALLIASEPLDDDPTWQAVPEHGWLHCALDDPLHYSLYNFD